MRCYLLVFFVITDLSFTIRTYIGPKMMLLLFSSHLFWTSSSLDVPAGVTQDFSFLPSAVHGFIFLVRRIQSFLPLVDREVEFCVLTI